MVPFSFAFVDDSKEEAVESFCDRGGCVIVWSVCWDVVGRFVGGFGIWMFGHSFWGLRKLKLIGSSSLSEYSLSPRPLLQMGGRYSFSIN